jgi:hypothetical protein
MHLAAALQEAWEQSPRRTPTGLDSNDAEEVASDDLQETEVSF